MIRSKDLILIIVLLLLKLVTLSAGLNRTATLCVRPYIVKIDADEQQKEIDSLETRCLYDIVSMPIGNDSLKCPMLWDSVICWPETYVNQSVYVPCPHYVNKFNMRNNVGKHCVYDHQLQSAVWTKANYTSCLSYDKKDFCDSTASCSLEAHMKYIVIIRVCGYMASMVSLILSIIVLLRPKMRCPRNYVHVNLFFAFVARTILVMLVDTVNKMLQDNTSSNSIGSSRYLTMCRVIVTIFRYTGSVYHMAIFSEAVYLVLLLKFPYYNEAKGCKFCIIISWTLPIFWNVPWVLLRVFVENYWCWQTESDVNLVLKIPHTLILISNIVCAVFIIRILYSKMRVRQLSREKVMKYRRLAKSILILIPIFGLHFILFAWVPYVSTLNYEMLQCFEIFITYVETFFNVFQGLVVSITCCFMHREAQLEILLLILQLLRKLKIINQATYTRCMESGLIRRLRFLNSELRNTSLTALSHHANNAPTTLDTDNKSNQTTGKRGSDKSKKPSSFTKPKKSQPSEAAATTSSTTTSILKRHRKCCCCWLCLFGNQKNDFFLVETNGRYSKTFTHQQHHHNHHLLANHGISSLNAEATLDDLDDQDKVSQLQLSRKKEKRLDHFVEITRQKESILKIVLPAQIINIEEEENSSKTVEDDEANTIELRCGVVNDTTAESTHLLIEATDQL